MAHDRSSSIGHLDKAPNAAAQTPLHRNILDVFNECGVQIMTLAYEGDPETPENAPRESWFAPPARPADAEGDSRS